jgi:competence protein ComEA
MQDELEVIDFAKEEKSKFNFDEFLLKNKLVLTFIFLGIIFAGIGIFFIRQDSNSSKVEILEPKEGTLLQEIVVEVAGAVEKPGVYKFQSGARVDDALIAAGGLSFSADREWVEKMLNRAAKLTDGQKIFIPDKQSSVLSARKNEGYQNVSSNFSASGANLVNINTASAKELDSLPGIGQVYAQKIIEQRPYSNLEELVSKKVIPQSLYEKIKDKITVF